MPRREIRWASPKQDPDDRSTAGFGERFRRFVPDIGVRLGAGRDEGPDTERESSRFRKFGLGYTYHSRDQLRLPAGW
jgi:hypothetical protein